jgi:hypothetical protein
MDMSFTRFLALLIIGLGGFIFSRAAGTAQEKAPDLSAPGEEHKKLDVLVGTWDVATKFVIAPGKEQEGSATCHAEWIMDGRFLRQDYSSTIAGKPFTVVQYLGFDRLKGKFFELHINCMHTDVMHNEGTISRDGKSITFLGPRIDSATRKEGKVRSVTTFVNKDTFTLEWYFIDADGKEAKVVTLTHKRKKAQ